MNLADGGGPSAPKHGQNFKLGIGGSGQVGQHIRRSYYEPIRMSSGNASPTILSRVSLYRRDAESGEKLFIRRSDGGFSLAPCPWPAAPGPRPAPGPQSPAPGPGPRPPALAPLGPP